MYCNHCGNIAADAASFCPHCGAKLTPGAPALSPAPAPTQSVNTPFDRKWLIPDEVPGEPYRHPFTDSAASRSASASAALLRSAAAYKDSQYPYAQKVQTLEEEEKQIREWLNDKSVGTLLFGIGMLLLFFVAFKTALRCYSDSGLLGSMPILGTIVLLCALGILAIALCLLYHFLTKFTHKPKKLRRLQEIEIEIRQIYAEFQSQIDDRTSPVRLNAMNYAWLFPTLDVSCYQIGYMIRALQTGRARSFQEALLIYDRSMHESRMENIADQTAEYARRSAEAAEQTAESARAAADAAASLRISLAMP